MKGTTIEFNVQITAEGTTLMALYEGEIEQDGSMKGAVYFGGLADGTWTARRAPTNPKEPPEQP